MTITIKLRTENAAFNENPTEAIRIIREWADSLMRQDLQPTATSVQGEALRDYNGNTVGSVTITGR